MCLMVYSVVAVLYVEFVLHVILIRPWNMFCTFTFALSIVPVLCQIRLFLQFLNFELSWYVAQILSELFWNGSRSPYYQGYHFCFHVPHVLNFYYEICFILLLRCLLSQTFLSRYFSWTNRDSHLSLHVSCCSPFRVMCDAPNIAVFCTESIECFHGTASKFFFKHFVTLPVYPITTGIIMHFMFHIRCISIHKLLTSFFTALFCVTFLHADNTTSIRTHVFLVFVFIYIWSICHPFIICVYPSVPWQSHLHIHV